MSSTAATTSLPPISHVLETCISVRHIATSVKFYRETFLIEPFLDTPRMAGFALGPTTLLLFQLGATADDSHTPNGGLIPGHGPTSSLIPSLLEEGGAKLKQHFCLAVQTPHEVSEWDAHLQKLGVKILGRVEWERGGRSVYFEDRDGNVGEVGSRGIWAHY